MNNSSKSTSTYSSSSENSKSDSESSYSSSANGSANNQQSSSGSSSGSANNQESSSSSANGSSNNQESSSGSSSGSSNNQESSSANGSASGSANGSASGSANNKQSSGSANNQKGKLLTSSKVNRNRLANNEDLFSSTPLPLNSPIPESEISLPKSVNLNEENETFVKKIRKTKSSNRVVPKRTLKNFPKPKRSTLIRKKSLYFYVGKNNINKLNKTITTRIEKHMDEIKKEIPEMIILFLKNTDSNPTTIKLLCKQ
jgi:hypothetical protein